MSLQKIIIKAIKRPISAVLIFIISMLSSHAMGEHAVTDAVILYVHQMGLPEEGTAINGQVDLQIHNASAVAISRVRIEPVESYSISSTLPPVQIPSLAASETVVSSIEVRELPVSATPAPLWNLTYYVGDIKHEKKIVGYHSL